MEKKKIKQTIVSLQKLTDQLIRRNRAALALLNMALHRNSSITALARQYFFIFLIAESIDLAGTIYSQRAIQISPSVSFVAAVESTLPLLVILLSAIFYVCGSLLKISSSLLSVFKTQCHYGQDKIAVSIVIGIGIFLLLSYDRGIETDASRQILEYTPQAVEQTKVQDTDHNLTKSLSHDDQGNEAQEQDMTHRHYATHKDVIRGIQLFLTQLHYDPGKPDGIKERKTKRAITFFIVNEGLDESISDRELLRYLEDNVRSHRD